ncbi:WecB/TagA/CpsF family glycosyltransferase [Vibrio sp. RC27]
MIKNILEKKSRCILGTEVKVKSSKQIFNDINDAIDKKSHLKLAFANANLLNMVYEDIELKRALKSFHLLNDGAGVDVVSKIKYGEVFPENLNGTDLLPLILKNMKRGNVFLYGAREASVSVCFERLKREHPHLNFVGYLNGYDRSHDEIVINAHLKNSSIDILLVAFGNPIQEKWIAQHCNPTNVRVAIGVGAFFDFHSGMIKRAPKTLRDLRGEWLYRLLLEPKRLWKRYLLGSALFFKRAFWG